jgi:hypothetical protein
MRKSSTVGVKAIQIFKDNQLTIGLDLGDPRLIRPRSFGAGLVFHLRVDGHSGPRRLPLGLHPRLTRQGR